MTQGAPLALYGYYRSSATYRVRIALAMKGLDAVQHPVDVKLDAHRRAEFLAVNPGGLVPALVDGGHAISQSLAIIEYLEDRFPEPPLFPSDPVRRAHARALALDVACDIHPLQNLRVLQRLKALGHDDADVLAWYRHWVEHGLAIVEARVTALGLADAFMLGPEATVAEVCLVPQLYNARRYGCDLSGCPTLVAVDARCRALPAFAAAAPERQPDAPPSP